MVTGDNAHCGHYIARACNILPCNTAIYLSTPPQPHSDTVLWSNMDPTQASPAREQGLSTAEVVQRCAGTGAELAITGKAMTVLTRTGTLDSLLLHTVSTQQPHTLRLPSTTPKCGASSFLRA